MLASPPPFVAEEATNLLLSIMLVSSVMICVYTASAVARAVLWFHRPVWHIRLLKERRQNYWPASNNTNTRWNGLHQCFFVLYLHSPLIVQHSTEWQDMNVFHRSNLCRSFFTVPFSGVKLDQRWKSCTDIIASILIQVCSGVEISGYITAVKDIFQLGVCYRMSELVNRQKW